MDLSYEPVDVEMRTLYGLKLEQTRNTAVIEKSMFDGVVSKDGKLVSKNRVCQKIFTCDL